MRTRTHRHHDPRETAVWLTWAAAVSITLLMVAAYALTGGAHP